MNLEIWFTIKVEVQINVKSLCQLLVQNSTIILVKHGGCYIRV